MTKSIEERFEESFKYGGNSQYLDQLYEQYEKIKPFLDNEDEVTTGHER